MRNLIRMPASRTLRQTTLPRIRSASRGANGLRTNRVDRTLINIEWGYCGSAASSFPTVRGTLGMITAGLMLMGENLLDPGCAVPVAVARPLRREPVELRGNRHDFAGIEQHAFHQRRAFGEMRGLRAHPHDVHAEPRHLGQLPHEIADPGRLRLDPVQDQERLPLEGAQGETLRMIEAAE